MYMGEYNDAYGSFFTPGLYLLPIALGDQLVYCRFTGEAPDEWRLNNNGPV